MESDIRIADLNQDITHKEWRMLKENCGGNEKLKLVLEKGVEEINLDDFDKALVRTHLNSLQQMKGEILKFYIWDESKLVKRRVFPIDFHEGFFYYGLMLPKLEDHKVKDKIIGKRQVLNYCLVTSKRELIELDLRAYQDLKIDFGDLPSFLPSRWRLEHIRRFLDSGDEKVDGALLLKKIVNQYKKYLFIRNDTWYKIHAVWDIGTYLYPIFEAYSFLEMRGLSGTGKSKSMVVSSYISFNGGQIMVNPSEATLFREKDEVRGTSYFDEAEKLWIFNKSTKQWEGDIRVELINASYTKEGRVPRQEKIGNKFVTRWYSPFAPIQLASVNGLYGATETRAITRITTKSPNDDERGEVEPSEDRNQPIWEEIRDECYRFGLYCWKDIKDIYNNFPKDIGLKRRDYQIWKPLLAIAKFIDENLYLEILEFAIELSERRLEDSIPDTSFDYAVLNALKGCLESQTGKIYVNEIKIKYCYNEKRTEGLNDRYLNRNISNHLDKLGFKEFRGRDKVSSFFDVSKEIFNEIVSPICPNLAFLSTLSTLSTSLYNNNIKNNVDNMAIGGDKKAQQMAIVAIGGENVDGREEGGCPEDLKIQEEKLL